MPALLTIKQAAEALAASEKSVRRWIDQGAIECSRKGQKRRGRHYLRIRQAAIDRFLDRITENAI